MFDSFWRAQDLGTLRTVIRSAPFRNVIGDMREPDGQGGYTPNSLRRAIPGSVDYVYFPPNSVVITPAVYDNDGNIITPAVTDGWCWIQLRIYGAAEVADDDVEDGSDARFDRSRIRKWMQNNGTFRTIRDVRVYEYTLGNGKRMQIWHGRDMAENLPPSIFHEYLGGNFYG